MKCYTQVYVKNSYEAAEVYCKAFGAEITRAFKNENDTAYEHCELSVDGEGILKMTLEELWELFPIILTEHKSEWSNYYSEMEAVLKEALRDRRIVGISHIGSTAINGIWAKPIVDILVEIARDENMQAVAEQIEACGFLRMSEEKGRLSFNKGYTENGFGEKVYHLHLRFAGDNDECYFRDYMNEHPQLAKEYEKLKLGLWKRFAHDRDGYTNAKTDFIKKYTAEAKKQYRPLRRER